MEGPSAVEMVARCMSHQDGQRLTDGQGVEVLPGGASSENLTPSDTGIEGHAAQLPDNWVAE